MWVSPYRNGQEAALQIIMLTMGITFGLLLLFMLVLYVFEAIGLYKLSKNRGYQKPWIAFIPVANAWVLGGLADNINYCLGKPSRWRIFLVAAEAVWSVGYYGYIVMMMAAFPAMFHNAMLYGSDYNTVLSAGWSQLMAVASLVSLVSMGRVVLRAIASYKIYQDYSPKNAVLFLIFSVLLGLTPFFLFAVRNRVSATLYWKNQPRPTYQPPAYGAPPTAPPPNPPEGPSGNPPYPPRH